MTPLSLTDEFDVREATLVGAETEAIFAPFARHTEEADIVIIHRDCKEPVVMLPWEMWKRVMLTVAATSGKPLPAGASD